MKELFRLACGALLLANVAGASIILNLVGAPTPGTGSEYIWTYAATLSTDQNFRTASSGDFTEIFDFSTFVSASWTSGVLTTANAAISEQLTGPVNPPAGRTDSPAVENIVVMNAGSTIWGSSVTGAVGDLGELVIVALSGTVGMDGTEFSGSFATQAQKVSDQSTTFNQGYLPTPPVPEPITFSLMGAGLLAAGLLGRRHTKKYPAA